jgi:hypothetical protein
VQQGVRSVEKARRTEVGKWGINSNSMRTNFALSPGKGGARQGTILDTSYMLIYKAGPKYLKDIPGEHEGVDHGRYRTERPETKCNERLLRQISTEDLESEHAQFSID